MKKMPLFFAIAGLCLVVGTASSQSFTFSKWDEPSSDYTSELAKKTNNGFTIKILKSARGVSYGVQVLSLNGANAKINKPGDYILTFKAIATNTNNEFKMFSRLGAEDMSWNYFKDTVDFTLTPGVEETHSLRFLVREVKLGAVLYFQFGYADAGTSVEISDIKVTPIFNRKDYGFYKNGVFFISKRIVDTVGGTGVVLKRETNNWKRESMTFNDENNCYEYDTKQKFDSSVRYCFQILPFGEIYVPHAILEKLSNRSDAVRNVIGTGFDFLTLPIDIENFPNENPDQSNSFICDVDKNIPVNPQVNDKSFVVIIANENYQKEVKVQFAVNDGKIFKEYCEKTLGIPTKNIHFVQDATFGNMKSELRWINEVAQAYNGQAKLVFYYAGHGMPNEQDKSAYLLPVDGFSTEYETAIRMDELYNSLTQYPTQNVIVFLDACFSGSVRDNGMLASTRGIKIKPKADILTGKIVVFSAATGEETAYPYKEKQHGLFTYFLLKKLQETKGNVDYQTLSNYIIEQVKQQSIVVNQKSQTPQVNTSTDIQNTWQILKIK